MALLQSSEQQENVGDLPVRAVGQAMRATASRGADRITLQGAYMLSWKRVKGLALVATMVILGSSYAPAQSPQGDIVVGGGSDTSVRFVTVVSDSGAITYLSQGSAASGSHAGIGRGVKFYASASTNFPIVVSHGGAQPIVFGTSDTERARITGAGNVGIGTQSPAQKLHVVGDVRVDGTVSGTNVVAKYQDVAEWVRARTPVSAGTVLIIDPDRADGVLPAAHSYDTRIAGVVSPKPGITLGTPGDGKVTVAHSGRVKVKASVENGPIAIGDLLVSSATPGHAMRSVPIDVGGVSIHRPGTVLGKALEPLAEGRGEILVLLGLQ